VRQNVAFSVNGPFRAGGGFLSAAFTSTGPKGRFYQPRPKGLGKVVAIMFLGPERAVHG
jgi:hypothetical protein